MNKSLNNIFTLLIVFCAGLIISGCASKKKIAQAPVETVKELTENRRILSEQDLQDFPLHFIWLETDR